MTSNICPPMSLNRATFYPSFANMLLNIEYLPTTISSTMLLFSATFHPSFALFCSHHIEYLPIISSSVLLFLATLHYLPTTISSSILLCSPFTQSHLLLLHVLSVTQPASQEASALTFHHHPSVVHCQTISTRAQIIPIMSCTKSSYMMMSHYWR